MPMARSLAQAEAAEYAGTAACRTIVTNLPVDDEIYRAGLRLGSLVGDWARDAGAVALAEFTPVIVLRLAGGRDEVEVFWDGCGIAADGSLIRPPKNPPRITAPPSVAWVDEAAP